MIGFAEAECNNQETASAEGCKQLLDEEVIATERKNILFMNYPKLVLSISESIYQVIDIYFKYIQKFAKVSQKMRTWK